MTADAFRRAIAAFPALLAAAYGDQSVTLASADALALLDLYDAVEELTAAEPQVVKATPPIRTLWDPALSDANIELVMPCDADRPARAPRAAAWERALKRGTRRTAA